MTDTWARLLSSLDYRLLCCVVRTVINLIPFCVSFLLHSVVGCGMEFAAWQQTAQGTRVQSRLIRLEDML
jgi:hypothetical protein